MSFLAQKCIQNHKNPIVKGNFPAQKLFFAAKTADEKNALEENLNYLKDVLDFQKVEKRSRRAHCVWLQEKNLAQVTKVVKNLTKLFGFQNKDGLFLYPEEMLFLLETNKLEVFLNDVSLSVEKCYECVTNCISLTKYRVYKKLALLGYKLIRAEQYENIILKKRRLQEPVQFDLAKRLKHDPDLNLEQSHTTTNESSYISNVLQSLRSLMPCTVDIYQEECIKPNYYIFIPTNITNSKPDFHLFIWERDQWDDQYLNCPKNVHAICNDDVALFKSSYVHVPYLL
ncbi:hypothetical protein ABEB36_014102 [Hypothenemus hampei]|uniref:tRNA-splicing endonuclease subunit Sen54 N-terminal domain-containing protein n=1 Tax=Hypothenemus hampei TaxID=57062 RepID=A0ABD1E3J2_HYPHA